MSSPISANSWNNAVQNTGFGLLPVGKDQSFGAGGNLPWGRLPNRGRQKQWVPIKHPWQIIPYWDAELPLDEIHRAALGRDTGAWCCRIEPGLINGWPPAIWMPTEFVPRDARVWANKYGKDDKKIEDLKTDRIQVLLTDNPQPFIKLEHFFDATSSYYGADGMFHAGSYPMFFKYMRVREPEKLSGFENFLNEITQLNKIPMPSPDFGSTEPAGEQLLLDILGGNAEIPGTLFEDEQFNYGPRCLVSCDIVLKVIRPRRVQQFQQDEFGFERLAGFTIEMPTTTEYQATLYHTSLWQPPNLGFSFSDLLLGLQPPDPGFDELVIGKIYFVSPDLFDIENSPDASWMPFVEHSCYWNLNYASQMIIDPFKMDQSLDYFKQIGAVLAGGSAFLIIGMYADFIEVQYDTIANAMNKTDTSGKFWNA